MSTRSSYEPGTPCWIDLMTPDVDASTAFYTGLFGWDAEDQFDDQGTRIYTNLMRDGQLVAGMAPHQPEMAGAPPVWNVYVATDDIDATSAEVEAAGGTVLMPAMDVMEEGRMAVYADPTGAVIAAWQAGRRHGAAVVNEPGAWSWTELMTRDLEAALAFHTEVFGWSYHALPMPVGTYSVIEGGDEGGLGGLMAMPEGMPEMVPNHWSVYFTIDDTQAVIDRAVALGGMNVQGPDDAPGIGAMTTLHDPAGGSFMVLQPPASQ